MAWYEGGTYTIRKYADGSELRFGRGRFDKWCVFHLEADGKRRAMLDSDYFADLSTLARKYGTERIHGNFVAVFSLLAFGALRLQSRSRHSSRSMGPERCSYSKTFRR